VGADPPRIWCFREDSALKSITNGQDMKLRTFSTKVGPACWKPARPPYAMNSSRGRILSGICHMLPCCRRLRLAFSLLLPLERAHTPPQQLMRAPACAAASSQRCRHRLVALPQSPRHMHSSYAPPPLHRLRLHLWPPVSHAADSGSERHARSLAAGGVSEDARLRACLAVAAGWLALQAGKPSRAAVCAQVHKVDTMVTYQADVE
jgi:hypothetical protein